jgi:hypothetical protein
VAGIIGQPVHEEFAPRSTTVTGMAQRQNPVHEPSEPFSLCDVADPGV